MFFVVFCVFLFFKQKTAYEMRISDWSSDVCSSDLGTMSLSRSPMRGMGLGATSARPWSSADWKLSVSATGQSELTVTRLRSEEHTSELQSLMRISYAVFCLKKKKIKLY